MLLLPSDLVMTKIEEGTEAADTTETEIMERTSTVVILVTTIRQQTERRVLLLQSKF